MKRSTKPGFADNAAPTYTPDQKSATAGDYLNIQFISPGGGYDHTTPLLVAQLYPTGSLPGSPVGFPEVHVNPAPGAVYPIAIVHDGSAIPYLSGNLLPTGLSFGFTVPAALTGLNVMFQGLCVAPNPGNAIFTAADAHSISIV